MRFFSKITVICNLCFIAAVLLRRVEMAKAQQGNFSGAIPVQPLESTIVVLGYGAIVVNFVFNMVVLALLLLKKPVPAPKWILLFNLLLLLLQVYYFFFDTSL
ncbi:MAG TPA: hypothetical protein PKC39_11905 [Ferruginibacter sp.]|nr:hypothetical protein [Ferruginibacter sp.]HMP21654.1 hypothetical protein [Ferruginibacter sp.]